ncbi:MAG TPA: SgcJ/EcaC family oxidoreductase [Rhizomicrobium sp.]|jgi:uncharacterized protein (TIGR02246 family)
MKRALFALCLAFAPLGAQASGEQDLVSQFLASWNAADAKGLSALFTEDADFVSPFGVHAAGRTNIEAFYAMAFSHGFAGSKGTGEIIAARRLAPGLILVDARFAITRPDHPAEKGIMAAIFARTPQGWRIAALRENEGAGDLSAFAPAPSAP